MNPEIALGAGLALTAIIVAIALAFGRRSSRLEDRFADPGILQPGLGHPAAPVAPPAEYAPDRVSSVDATTHHSEEPNRATSDPGAAANTLTADLANLREGMVAVLPSTKAEFMAVQQSVQNYQERIELLRTTLNSLQSEQLALHKLLESCNADLKDIERFAASISNIRNEHASIKKQLAELNTRFQVVSEVLADFLPSEDSLGER
jgi:prefoldin subunit 5